MSNAELGGSTIAHDNAVQMLNSQEMLNLYGRSDVFCLICTVPLPSKQPATFIRRDLLSLSSVSSACQVEL